MPSSLYNAVMSRFSASLKNRRLVSTRERSYCFSAS